MLERVECFAARFARAFLIGNRMKYPYNLIVAALLMAAALGCLGALLLA